jgi:dienelactone hydrolase
MKRELTFLLYLFLINNLTAQTSEVEFTTQDRIKISATFHQTENAIGKSPAIILIHQGGSSKEEWTESKIWKQLIEKGYVLLAYDIRLHGKSEKDKGDIYNLFNNPVRAPLDLIAAINFLKNNPKIDSNRIGILGASIGGNLAAVTASSDKYEIKSVVVISAKTAAVKNLSVGTKELKFKNAFYIASEDEQNGMRAKWANELFIMTSGDKKVSISKGNKHGSYILKENKQLATDVINWFNKTL